MTGANPAIEVKKSWMLLRKEPSLLSSYKRTVIVIILPFTLGHLVIDACFPKGEGRHQRDATLQRKFDKALLLLEDEPHLAP